MTAHDEHAHCGPGYASPAEALQAPREQLLYVNALYDATGIDAPDYLATVDVDPAAPTYAQVIQRTPMPDVGDELHHFGWNACSSCHGAAHKARRYLIVPGFGSSRIHIIDVAAARAQAAPSDRAGGGQAEDQPERAAHGTLPHRRPCADLDARGRGR